MRRGHGVGRPGRWWFGMRRVSLTQGTVGFFGQACNRFELAGAATPGLGWHRWDGHAWLGPSEVQHDEKPYENKQSELVVKQMGDHGLAPSRA